MPRNWILLVAAATAMACKPTNDTHVAGCYVFGHEVNVFSPVNQDSTFWVTGPADVLQQLRMKHDSLTSMPYQAVAAELVATRSTERGDGFAQDYDGLIEVHRIVEVRRAEPDECSSGRDTPAGAA